MAHARASGRAVLAEPHNAVKVSTACPSSLGLFLLCRSLCSGAPTPDTAFRGLLPKTLGPGCRRLTLGRCQCAINRIAAIFRMKLETGVGRPLHPHHVVSLVTVDGNIQDPVARRPSGQHAKFCHGVCGQRYTAFNLDLHFCGQPPRPVRTSSRFLGVYRRQHRQAAGAAVQAMRNQKPPAAFSGPARGLRERLSAKLKAVRRGNPMDQRIEAFLADVLALAGEDLDAVREGVRVALASCEALFGCGIGEHLKLVLSVIDRQVR
jgi:hypothetical protein